VIGSADAPKRGCGGGHEDEGFGDIGSLLEVADEAAATAASREHRRPPAQRVSVTNMPNDDHSSSTG
jgi:hypothetical protein